MRILITNINLETVSGTVLYVRDLAVQLLRRGHLPVVFSPTLGKAAEELRIATIPVTDDLASIRIAPDIIHGHHHPTTMAALAHFENTPALFVCHDRRAWHDSAPHHPRLLRYVAIEETCAERLTLEDGVDPAHVVLLPNAVDLQRFARRAPLPERPQRALFFSSVGSRETNGRIVQEACEHLGIPLDFLGAAFDKIHARPEQVLPDYDLVFAVGRSALEAAATGCAVIPCADRTGMGALVNASNVELIYSQNFSRRALTPPLTTDRLVAEIGRFNADDTARATDLIRAHAGLDKITDRLIDLYKTVRTEFAAMPPVSAEAERHAVAKYLQTLAPVADPTRKIEQRARAAEARLAVIEAALPMTPLTAEDAARIEIRHAAVPSEMAVHSTHTIPVDLFNGGSCVISGHAPDPVSVCYHWEHPSIEDPALFEGVRTIIFPPLAPGVAWTIDATIKAPARPGEYTLKIVTIQEGIHWHETQNSTHQVRIV